MNPSPLRQTSDPLSESFDLSSVRGPFLRQWRSAGFMQLGLGSGFIIVLWALGAATLLTRSAPIQRQIEIALIYCGLVAAIGGLMFILPGIQVLRTAPTRVRLDQNGIHQEYPSGRILTTSWSGSRPYWGMMSLRVCELWVRPPAEDLRLGGSQCRVAMSPPYQRGHITNRTPSGLTTEALDGILREAARLGLTVTSEEAPWGGFATPNPAGTVHFTILPRQKP